MNHRRGRLVAKIATDNAFCWAPNARLANAAARDSTQLSLVTHANFAINTMIGSNKLTPLLVAALLAATVCCALAAHNSRAAPAAELDVDAVRDELKTLFEAEFEVVEDTLGRLVSNFSNFNYKQCSPNFERRLIALHDELGVAGETPKLDRYVAERREEMFAKCAKHNLAYLESRIKLIPDGCFRDLQPLLEFSEQLDTKLNCTHTNCYEYPFAAKLSELIAKDFKPTQNNAFKRWILDERSPREQFLALYDEKFQDSCFYLAPTAYDSVLDHFVSYLDEYWAHKVDGLVRRWLKMRNICNTYIIDKPDTTERAFRYLPTALKRFKKA